MSSSSTGSACDTCKRRKLKCSGGQPCERCVNSGVACTYGSLAGRQGSIQYNRHLEQQIVELRAQLERVQSQAVEEPIAETISRSADAFGVDAFLGPGDGYVYKITDPDATSYHGPWAGLTVIRFARDMCAGDGDAVAGLPSGQALAEAFDSAGFSTDDIFADSLLPPLPQEAECRRLANLAFDSVVCPHECMDREVLFRELSVFSQAYEAEWTPERRRFGALLYAIIAVGRRYDTYESQPVASQEDPDQPVLLKGLVYYRASRRLLDTNFCRDLDSIRTIIMQTNFLLSASMLSAAHSSLCPGVAAALRMGLTSSVSGQSQELTAEERFQRRRVLSALYITDTNLASALGTPKMLQHIDPTRAIPLRAEDEHDEGRSLAQQHPNTTMGEGIIEAKLYRIWSAILNERFALHETAGNVPGKYVVPNESIHRHQEELNVWFRSLGEMLDTSDFRSLRVQLQLRMNFAGVQLVLYRPFLHHLLKERGDAGFILEGYSCASECVKAAMHIVWIFEKFHDNHVMHEADWFIPYHLSQAASILMFFVLGTNHASTVEESFRAALTARKLLAIMARRNVSAARSFRNLDGLILSCRSRIMGGSTGRHAEITTKQQFLSALGIEDEPAEESSSSSGRVNF